MGDCGGGALADMNGLESRAVREDFRTHGKARPGRGLGEGQWMGGIGRGVTAAGGLRQMRGCVASRSGPVLHGSGGAFAFAVDGDEPELIEPAGGEGDGGGDGDGCHFRAGGEE